MTIEILIGAAIAMFVVDVLVFFPSWKAFINYFRNRKST